MAGGYKIFGPTYQSTQYVRVLYEGVINGDHALDMDSVNAVAPNGDLAGRIAAITNNGIGFAAKGNGAIGFIAEDLGDMTNASLKASFYFRGGEYYVSVARMGSDPANGYTTINAGDKLTTDANGRLVKLTDPATETAVGVATTKAQAFTMGNMYQWAGDAANGGLFVGFILYM